MKKQFNFTDLKEEYVPFFEKYMASYLQKNPSDVENAQKYAAKMVRLKARKLYDYKQILKAIDSKVPLNEILSMHKSCAERNGSHIYYKCIEKYLCGAESVLDIGCGLNPCIVLSEYGNITRYYGYDNDTKITHILRLLNKAFFESRITVLSSFEWDNEELISNMHCDIVLVQKLISNLYYNRNVKLTDKIAQLDTKYYFITGCRMSLSRNVSISEEENVAIEWFIRRYGLKKREFIETPSEFGWILTK